MNHLTLDYLFNTSGPLYWFALAAAFVAAVLVLEVVLSLVGASMMNADTDVDVDPGLDVDAPDVDADIRIALDLDTPEVASGPDADTDVELSAFANVLRWFEIGSVPLMVWLVSFAGNFAILGFLGQSVVHGMVGFMIPGWIAALLAVLPALWLNVLTSRAFAAILPKTTTDIVSRRSLGGSVGKTTIGTATRDLPSNAVVVDRHGNRHTVRVKPYEGQPDIPPGTMVIVLRGPGPVYDALHLDTAQNLLQS